jgi:SAM-dependent methyltransferase
VTHESGAAAARSDGAPTASAWLSSNLARLAPAIRDAVSGRDNGPAVREHADGRLEIATADGQWLAVHGTNPHAAAAAFADTLLQAATPPTVLAIGLGLGFLLDALEARGAAIRVVLIEPVPGIAKALLARRDWTRWITSGQLVLLVGPDFAGAAEAWRAVDVATSEPRTFVHPALERACPDRVAAALMVAEHLVTGARANAEARRQFAGRYLTQTLANLPVVATEGDVAALAGLAAGRPAVVVGAGPSLDRRLDLLRAIAGRALVIAVDTATRPLLAAGVTPDLVVGVDPSETNAAHLRDLGDVRGLWLVGEPSLHPSVFPAFADRTFTFAVAEHEPWPWLAAQGVERGRLRAWGSVLTTAFDLACHLGCGPIAFLGADLAYSRGLQYCRHTTYEPRWRDCADDAARAVRFQAYLATHPHAPAPDVNGCDVLTAPHFLQFRDWILSRAAEWVTGGRGRRVLNASGEGILHGGLVEVVDAATVIDLVNASPADTEIRGRLHEVHARSTAGRDEVVARLAGAMSREAEWPLERWAAFASGTHSRAEVREAAASARRTLRTRADEARQLARARAPWDRLATVSEAQAAVHPDYAFASAQAEVQVAFALDDWRLRRSLAPPRESAALSASTSPGLDANARTPAAVPRRVLDVGCGLGRTMRPWVARGVAVDGADHGARMIAWATALPELSASRFFQTSGADCGAAVDGAYDLVTMFHALHRVRSRGVRRALLAAMARALRPDGVVHVQLPFFPDRIAATVPEPHVAWTWDAPAGVEDAGRDSVEVWVTPDDLPHVYADFAAVCADVRLQVVDFPPATRRFDESSERLAHVIVSGAASPTLARRVYGVE